jgi:multicomponent K+:H+ antiporter subunit E
MRRVPPIFAIVLLVMWLLLNGTLAFGHIVLGAVLSSALLAAAFAMRPLQPKMKHGFVLARLIAAVIADIVRSNIGVARVILGLAHDRDIRSGFMDVPLDMRDPHALAGLSMIITSTPGTIWVEFKQDKGVLTIHVLDLVDESEWIHRIKQRYERPLMEVFEQ